MLHQALHVWGGEGHVAFAQTQSGQACAARTCLHSHEHTHIKHRAAAPATVVVVRGRVKRVWNLLVLCCLPGAGESAAELATVVVCVVPHQIAQRCSFYVETSFVQLIGNCNFWHPRESAMSERRRTLQLVGEAYLFFWFPSARSSILRGSICQQHLPERGVCIRPVTCKKTKKASFALRVKSSTNMRKICRDIYR